MNDCQFTNVACPGCPMAAHGCPIAQTSFRRMQAIKRLLSTAQEASGRGDNGGRGTEKHDDRISEPALHPPCPH